DDEGPEVTLLAEPEGVFGRGASPSAPAAEEEEGLVAGVGHRVDGLGEEGRRAGDGEAGELRDRDAEVGRERRRDRLPAPFLHRTDPIRGRVTSNGPTSRPEA